MTFPYPENPNDWQTAYTRDHAYRDSGQHAFTSASAILAGTLLISAYLVVSIVSRFDFNIFPRNIQLIMILVLIAIVFFLLTAIQAGASRFASLFIKEFYRPSEEIDLSKIINNRLNGRTKLPPPLGMFFPFQYIMARDGELVKSDRWPAWSARNLGGPLLLIVFDGCALYLERGNRFSRVVGPGDKAPFLEWYETIKYVVDLRPKVEEGWFDVWTKDGINIKLKIQIECRIGDPRKNDPTISLVYPYDPVAVKKAIERCSVRWPNRLDGEPSEFTWIDAAWGQVTGIIPSYIGSRMLDDLFIAERNNGQILSPDAMKDIFSKLNNSTNGFGVFITDFQILKVEIPEEVYERQQAQWKAERQSIATIRQGQATALKIRSQQKARADAQFDLILAIANGLEKNESENEKDRFTEPLLLSLSKILDEGLRDPLLRGYLARETLETLEKLQDMFDKPSE